MAGQQFPVMNATLGKDYDLLGFNMSYPPLNWTGGGFPANMHRFEGLRIFIWSLEKYFIPVIIVAGFIGNGLSMVVFLCTYLKRLSISVYLAALAASDSLFLLTLTIMWLQYVHVPIMLTNGICQTVIYIGYCSSFLSVWFVVCFTVERYISICHPLKRPELCTASRAKKVVAALGLGSLVGYSCTLVTSGVEQIGTEANGFQMCTLLTVYYRVNNVLKYADTVVSLIIPFLLIVILNIIIAYRISYFYKRRQSSQPTGYYRRPSQSQEPSLYSRAQLKVTKMLLLLSSMFLLINLPFYAMRLRHFLMSFMNHDDYKPTTEFLVQHLLQIIYYTNFSINFMLYIVLSAKFRDAFKRFCWQLKYKTVRLIALGIYRMFRRDDSSTASGEQEFPAVLPLRHHYSVNTKFYV